MSRNRYPLDIYGDSDTDDTVPNLESCNDNVLSVTISLPEVRVKSHSSHTDGTD